jgi:hypothetical protein
VISTLELRHIIESALLPLSSTCQIDPSGSLQVKIMDPETGFLELLIMGPPTSTLNGREPIAKLIVEIREEFEIIKQMRSVGTGSQVVKRNE